MPAAPPSSPDAGKSVSCSCYCCQNFTRAYLHHLFGANEVLSATLAAIHNVHFYLQMMADAREAIERGEFAEFKQAFLQEYGFFK